MSALSDLFQDTANAIRGKTGETGTMKPAEFPAKINAIEVGGSAEDMEIINDLIDEINGEIVNGFVVTSVGADGAVLCQMVVAPGYTCGDPIYNGLISIPTKKPTETEVFAFSGWSLTEGGEADPSALVDVTEDRTVYAAFKASVRYYTVDFYVDGAVWKTTKTPYNGVATVTKPEKDNYIFTGWEPSNENIVADTNCHAQWRLSDKLADYSWSEIAAMSESGEAPERFMIGDTRTLSMTVDSKTYSLTARLVGFDHDDLSDGTGKAGMTFEIMDMPKTGKTDFIDDNYVTSAAYANFDQYAHTYVEDDLSSHIKQVSKKCYPEAHDEFTMLDAYMWRFSLGELGFANTLGLSVWADDGDVYEYFGSDDKKISGTSYYEYEEMVRYGANNAAVSWSTRTLYRPNSMWAISHNGVAWRITSSNDRAYILLGFCI